MRNVIHLEEIDSTNKYLKQLGFQNAAEGTTVIANRQTGGRGRMGKRFHSPDGGLYMSILLRPETIDASALLITTAAAAAVSRAIETMFNRQTKIKWVNDIYVDNRKVCGILAESVLSGDKTDFTVLGIGVNLYNTAPLPNDIKDIAGFVCDAPITDTEKEKFALLIYENFYNYYKHLEDKEFLEYYNQRQLLVDKEITVLQGGNARTAVALGIDDDFRLRILIDDNRETLSFGEVSIKL